MICTQQLGKVVLITCSRHHDRPDLSTSQTVNAGKDQVIMKR